MEQSSFSSLLSIVKNKKIYLIGASFLSVIHSILNLTPYLLSYIIIKDLSMDTFLIEKLKTYVFYTGVLMIVSYLCLYGSLVISHIAAFEILYNFRVQISKKISRLSLGFLQKKSSGSMKKILIDDIEKIEKFIAHNIPDITKAVVMPLLILISLFFIDYRLALASMLPLTFFLFWLFIIFTSSYVKQAAKKHYTSGEKMDGVIVEYVNSIKVMKVFNQEASSFENYRLSIEEYTKNVVEYIKKNNPFFAVIVSFISNSLLPILIVGIYLYFQNSIPLPILLLFFIIGVGFLKPVLAIGTIASGISSTLESVNRIENILLKEVEQKDTQDILELENFNIKYSNVSFKYDKEEVLRDLTLDIPQGKITAFIGASGSGKTTTAELLARFHDIEHGKISIGSKEIKKMGISQLMETVSFVFQDSFMFLETIEENIKMGKEASLEEVEEAGKIANAHDFIKELPQGYHTNFKDIKLSGGQMQRLQLARLVLKNAPIFILDEATSFADPKNEFEIQNALNKVIKNKTVIVIAHRLSTIKNADNIVIFKKGKIEAQGTHQQLIENSTTYQKMWESYNSTKDFTLKGDL